MSVNAVAHDRTRPYLFARWSLALLLSLPAACGRDTGPPHQTLPPAVRKPSPSPAAAAKAVPPTPAPPHETPAEAASRFTHILLLGFDRARDRQVGRTDAILVVRIDTSARRMGIVSIPRDLWVDIPGLEPGRINKVVRVGDRALGAGRGFGLLNSVIKQELGLAIDHVLAVDFAGFERAVDSLGGVPVHIRCSIRDHFISPGHPDGYERLELAAGRTVLSGRQALLFSRSRHGRGDLDRARRQQAVLVGLKKRAMTPAIIPRLPELLSLAEKHLFTDLGLTDLVRLARLGSRIEDGALHGLVLRPPIVSSFHTPDGKMVLALNAEKWEHALENMFEAPLPGTPTRAVCPKADVALDWARPARADRPGRENAGAIATGRAAPATE